MVTEMLKQAKLRWAGHVARMGNDRLPKRILFGTPPEEVGTPRVPGRRSGRRCMARCFGSGHARSWPSPKWLASDASHPGGEGTMGVVRSVAWRGRPCMPQPGLQSPDRQLEAQGRRGAVRQRSWKGFAEELRVAEEFLHAVACKESALLQKEVEAGGRGENYVSDRGRGACHRPGAF